MNQIRLLTFLFISTIAFSHAFGRAGDLDAPSLSLPANSEGRPSVMDVLSDKQFKFMRGRFINAFSTLMYSGDAASLNSFLSRLAQCKGAKVSVGFSNDQSAKLSVGVSNDHSDVSWTLTHNGWGDADAFQVAVNTAHIPPSAVNVPK